MKVFKANQDLIDISNDFMKKTKKLIERYIQKIVENPHLGKTEKDRLFVAINCTTNLIPHVFIDFLEYIKIEVEEEEMLEMITKIVNHRFKQKRERDRGQN